MRYNKNSAIFIAFLLLVIAGSGFIIKKNFRENIENFRIKENNPEITEQKNIEPEKQNVTAEIKKPAEPVISFVGPREGIVADAPTDYGLWSFAMPVPGVLSRSGQPLLSGFRWMKENGWKSDINLRVDGERREVGDDNKIPGFKDLGLNYLHLPIPDGSPPTEKQAITFLEFVTKPENQPAHVHCRGGIGRAGTMVALYRYAVQGWPMEKAIEESRPFQGGVSQNQEKWLINWAKTHAAGEFR